MKSPGKWITAIATIISLILAFLTWRQDNTRVLKITEFDLNGVTALIWDENRYAENVHAQSFLDCFDSTDVFFHLENHSNNDAEIYGFYLEIQVGSLMPEKVRIPLKATIIGEDKTLDVGLNDWNVVAVFDKYTVRRNSTIEVTASLEDSGIGSMPPWWFDAGFADTGHPIDSIIEDYITDGDNVKCKCRIVCKDTFGKLYYSNWEKVSLVLIET